MNLNNKLFLAKLIRKTIVAKDTFEIVLKPESIFSFNPGQYAWIELTQLKYPDKKGSRRAMSIVNIQNENNEIYFLFRGSESGFKKTLLELELGNEINVIGPFGASFCFPQEKEKPIILISGGVGLSPFLSLMRSLSKNEQNQRSITFIHAENSPESFPYKEEINTLKERFSNLSSIITYKKLEWKDIKDVSNIQNSLLYISGTQNFVNYIHEILLKNGIFEHQMRFEAFYPENFNTIELKKYFKNLINEENFSGFKKENLNILLSIINNTSHHIVITDANGFLLFANKAAQELTGYSFFEMEGQTPRLWGGMMPDYFYKDLWKSKLNGNVINAEILNRKKNNSLYLVMAHISPIKNYETGELLGFIGTEEDITKIREEENIAQEQKERFLQLITHINEVFWITELIPEEKVQYVSPMFEKIWGVPVENLYKNPRLWTDSIHTEDKKRVGDAFNAFINGKSNNYALEYRIIRPIDKQIVWIFDTCEGIKDEQGKITRLVGIARDITKERIIDQEKTEFVSLASHQLKTPIGAVSWIAEMLLSGDYGSLDEKQKNAVVDIYHTNLRMRELVNSLLNISRIDLGTFVIEPKLINCSEICDDVLKEMQPRIIDKKHEVIKKYAENLPNFSADPNLLRIIFQNLISNAVKYTPEHGRVTVQIYIKEYEFIISVSNNGEPIPEKDKSKLFSKLFRASNAQTQDPDGNGLGLYLVKQIVENGGGRIWFDSNPGSETTFYVSFPLSGMKEKRGIKKLE